MGAGGSARQLRGLHARTPARCFFGGDGGQPIKVHWGYPDPSNAEGSDEGRRRAFELTRQAIGYRMLQLLALPLASLSPAELKAALEQIAKS